MVKKITDLTAATALDGTEPVAAVQGGDTDKATVQQVMDFILSATMALLPTSGSSADIKVATELLSDVSADATANALIPDGAIILAVTTRVTGTITGGGVTGYAVGDGSDPNRWGDITGTAIGTTSDNTDWTATGLMLTAATDVVLTAAGGAFSAGAVRIVVHYIDATAPTS